MKTIETAKLRDLNSEKFKSYRVEWWDQSLLVPKFVDICVTRIKDENHNIN